MEALIPGKDGACQTPQVPAELRERATRMVFEIAGADRGAPRRDRPGRRPARHPPEALRGWVRRPRSTAVSGPAAPPGAPAHRRAGTGEPRAASGERDPQVGERVFRGGARPSPRRGDGSIDAHRDALRGRADLPGARQVADQSTYYAAKQRPPSARTRRDEQLKAQIQRVCDENYQVYGARKIWRAAAPRRHPGGPLHRRAADARAGHPGRACGARPRAPPARGRAARAAR